MGLKPSPLDGETSDGEDDIEGDLPYGGVKEVNSTMIDMMVELSDCDEGDMELLHSHIGAAVGEQPTLLCGFGM